MKAARGLLTWAGLEVSESTAFGLGLGFALSFEGGRLSDCMPERFVIVNAARSLGLECEEFGTVSREKALEYLREHLGRGTPVAGRVRGEMILLTRADEKAVMAGEKSIPWEDLEEGLFVGSGPVKAFLYTYRKTRHIPPLSIVVKKSLSEMARRFLFPDKPTRGIKVAGMLSGHERIEWVHEPALGHRLLADFLEEAGQGEEARFFRKTAEKLGAASGREASALISEEKGIFSGLL